MMKKKYGQIIPYVENCILLIYLDSTLIQASSIKNAMLGSAVIH